ncbi:ankyrin repeat domain-containing protein [Paludibaculum fermentans]|uniref:Ankyrin repeat domain-containing protein n=1 Tax=Paludibaculum fermentans TaxID=1473598 RepID=A0A7S7NPC6_PALFE|nr:ankyrin repeat domain-containing protein [Paludibaculum fermentans]QOY87327.1 ankyrin repeat domain-containing protein [Paludibaculum fermentans]
MKHRRGLLLLLLTATVLAGCGGAHDTSTLIGAAREGDLAAMNKQLDQGAGVNQSAGVNNWTVLQHAIHKNQPQAVDLLLAKGADPNLAHGKMTPLMMAAGYGYDGIVRSLLKYGADPKVRNSDGKTARDYAKSGVSDIDRFTYGREQSAAVAALDAKPAAH